MSDQKRKVRSFVRREGRMTSRQEKAIENYWAAYGLEADQGIFNFADIFQRNAPVVLEIGFGNGKSLFSMAQTSPEQDFIGVEVHRPGVGSLLADIHEADLKNLRVICADAVEVLDRAIANASLDKVQIFFPDPWHKKRHNKRRLIQPSFVALLHAKLKLGAQVHLATDWEDYAEQMMQVFSEFDGFINPAGHGQYIQEETARPTTKFEQRGQRLGHGVWDLVFVKE